MGRICGDWHLARRLGLAAGLGSALACAAARPSASGAGQCRAGPVPVPPPDSTPAWIFADSNRVGVGCPHCSPAYVKDVVVVAFHPTASPQDRQAAVELVCGEVVGGLPWSDGGGYYYVRVPHDSLQRNVHAAIDELRRLPAVHSAFRDLVLSRHRRTATPP